MWYRCTSVACDSRYTLCTVGELTPRATSTAVLSRLIDRHQNFAKIFLHFEKCSLHNIASFASFGSTIDFGMMMAYVFRIISNDCTVTACTHVWLL